MSLSPRDAKSLLDFLRGLERGSLTGLSSRGGSGYPCSLAVERRQPRHLMRGHCDLMGVRPRDAELPTPALVRRLFALAEPVSASPLIRGWSEHYRPPSLSAFDEVRIRREMDLPGAPSWIILLQMHALPHGGSHLYRINLRDGPTPSADMVTFSKPYAVYGIDPRATAEHRQGSLSDTTTRRLLASLKELEGGELNSLLSSVDDGAPCALKVFGRDPIRVMQGGCNLAGLSPEERESPTPALILLVLHAAAELAPPTQRPMIGWCDPVGNIGIGEI